MVHSCIYARKKPIMRNFIEEETFSRYFDFRVFIFAFMHSRRPAFGYNGSNAALKANIHLEQIEITSFALTLQNRLHYVCSDTIRMRHRNTSKPNVYDWLPQFPGFIHPIYELGGGFPVKVRIIQKPAAGVLLDNKRHSNKTFPLTIPRRSWYLANLVAWEPQPVE